MQIKNLKAVTLVEVLVVLTIMGVVAALTIPGLTKHSQKTEYARLAQKGYATLEGAIDMAVAETGTEPDKWAYRSYGNQVLRNYLAKYISAISKDCLNLNALGCSYKYKSFKNHSNSAFIPSSYIIASDGIIIGGLPINSVSGGGISAYPVFYVDVNGKSEPNMEGVDLFFFSFGKYDADCSVTAENRQWKLCPILHAKNLMEDNWTITYW